jgi:hypothetical protein
MAPRTLASNLYVRTPGVCLDPTTCTPTPCTFESPHRTTAIDPCMTHPHSGNLDQHVITGGHRLLRLLSRRTGGVEFNSVLDAPGSSPSPDGSARQRTLPSAIPNGPSVR